MQSRLSSLFALVFLTLLIAGSYFVGCCVANPYSLRGFVPPDQETYPPQINVVLPTNNTAYNTSRLPLKFNVTAPQSRTASSTGVDNVAYKADWRKEAIDVLQGGGGQGDPSFDLLLSNIPEGQHSITINVRGVGTYMNQKELSYTIFFIPATTKVSFTMDYTAPTITLLLDANKSQYISNFPLSFTVNEQAAKTTYCLDGLDNVTIAGNTTLTGLPVGEHTVTVYAWDMANNVGTSETVPFTIVEPEPETVPAASFPVETVAVASTATVTVVGAGLFLFSRHRKMAKLQQ